MVDSVLKSAVFNALIQSENYREKALYIVQYIKAITVHRKNIEIKRGTHSS